MVEDRHVEFAVFAVLGVLVGYAVAGLVVDSTHGYCSGFVSIVDHVNVVYCWGQLEVFRKH